MKNSLTLAGLTGLLLAAPALHAQETARVISSVALLQQVAVPRQVCTTQQVQVEQPKSGAGALMGAIAGGALGNQIGGGSGRAAATVAGVFGGAILGDRIEGPTPSRMQDQTSCYTQTVYESRTVGYNVTYEYAGRQYQVQMPQDPGPTIRVQVSPIVPGASGATQTWQTPPPPAPVVNQGRPYSRVAPAYAPVYSSAYEDGYGDRAYRHPWR